MQEDPELLRRYVQDRSDEAFTTLVRRHLNLVYFSALRRANGDTHLAEDITQNVFVALAREAAALRTHAVLAGWLFVATRHAAAQAMRAERRRINREQEAFAMQETSSEPVSPPDWEVIRPQLERVLDELDERDRDAILLRYFQNRPFAEIGRALRVSDDAARMRVDRALEKLRTLLVRRGVTSTTAALAIALEHQAAAAVPVALAASVQSALLASGAIGGALGTFHFMSTTAITLGLASVVSLFAIGTAVYQANQARQAEASLAAASKVSTERIRELQAKMAAAEKSLGVAQQSLRESRATAPTPTATAAPEDEAQKKKRKAPPVVSFSERLKDPEYAALWRKNSAKLLEQVHEHTYPKLNLDAHRLARLKTLLVDREAAKTATMEAGRRDGLSNVEIAQAVEQALQPWAGEIRGMIGEAGYAELERDVKAMPWRGTVESGFGYHLKLAGLPLSPDQGTNLSLSFADYFEATWRKDPSTWRGIQSFTNPQWDVNAQTGLNRYAQSLLDHYTPVLPPAQLQALRTYFVEQTKWTELNQRK
jgi:RNA polymerase sigma factor (sigma-70 family)